MSKWQRNYNMQNNTISLEDYIKNSFNNSTVRFSMTTTKTPQQIRKQVAHGGFIVVGDNVCQVKYKTTAVRSWERPKVTLAEKAVRDCKKIFRDLSERDALKMPYSVLDAWRLGKELSK